MGAEYPEDGLLVHLCTGAQWQDARAAGEVRPDSLETAGFVHLSTPAQVHLPANRLFRGRTDMVALYVDRAGLHAALRWEPGVPGDPDSMVFPHLYGPLPTEAVVAVRPYLPGLDGAFSPVIPRPPDDGRHAPADDG